MKTVTLCLPEFLYDFYRKIAELAGLPLERVLDDALFRLAGQLAAEALDRE